MYQMLLLYKAIFLTEKCPAFGEPSPLGGLQFALVQFSGERSVSATLWRQQLPTFFRRLAHRLIGEMRVALRRANLLVGEQSADCVEIDAGRYEF